MDIYYFYNGINNILKLALKDKKYLANYKLILNDPLVIIDFEDSNKLKGGATAVATGAVKNPEVISKIKDVATKGTNKKDGSNESNSNKEKEGETEAEAEELSPKEQALKIIKVLFSIGYYLCLFSILPLLPFIAISYYSFKRLKIFYNEKMGTL
jgi:hypothetical protein